MSDIILKHEPRVLPPRATVREACQLMREHRIGAVLVADADRRLLGIFTIRDAVCRVLADGKTGDDTTLAEVMTPHPQAMPPGKTAIEALRLMQDGGYRHMPVVENGKIVGIVSRWDFRGTEQDRLDEETGIWERI
ncbi:MAG: CBS domain-containing protein [Alphaproteobacteria bacterium]